MSKGKTISISILVVLLVLIIILALNRGGKQSSYSDYANGNTPAISTTVDGYSVKADKGEDQPDLKLTDGINTQLSISDGDSLRNGEDISGRDFSMMEKAALMFEDKGFSGYIFESYTYEDSEPPQEIINAGYTHYFGMSDSEGVYHFIVEDGDGNLIYLE